jgi:hypothetical protein
MTFTPTPTSRPAEVTSLDVLSVDSNQVGDTDRMPHLEEPQSGRSLKRRQRSERRQRRSEGKQRRSEKKRRLEAQKRADTQRRLEEQRRLDAQQRLEEKRRVQAQRQLETQRRNEEQQRIEAHRRLEEKQRLDTQRQLEERRRAEEQWRLQAQRQLETQRRLEEQQRIEAHRRLEEKQRLETQRQLEERRRHDEQKRAEEQRRLRAQYELATQRRLEEQQRIEAQRRLEEKQRLETQRRLDGRQSVPENRLQEEYRDVEQQRPGDVGLSVDRQLKFVDQPQVGIQERASRLSTPTVTGHHIGEGQVVGVLSFALYSSLAALMAFVYHIYPIDAVARMANGFYVLYSSDPHLAAIGFVWNPLQSIGDLVVLLFKDAWPQLATRDMAGALVSAASMTGAVHQLRSALRERGVDTGPRLVLTALFAISPMILFYAADGMSEALYLFTLIATTRYLLRWYQKRDLRSLVYAATALGLAYLARNEALGASVAACALVFLVSALQGSESLRMRLKGATGDTAVFAFPVTVAVVGWSLCSYIITGQLFPQSRANSIQIKVTGFNPGDIAARFVHELTALGALAPLLPIVLAFVLVQAVRRRDGWVLFPLAVLGGGLAFDLIGYLHGSLFDWLRFYILVIPLAVLVTGALLTTTRTKMPALQNGLATNAGRTWLAIGMSAAAFALVIPSFFTSSIAMVNKSIGAGETSEYLRPIFDSNKPIQQTEASYSWLSVQAIDSYLSGLHLKANTVIVDDSNTCVANLIVQSSNPKIFVIPNDRYFQRVAADPLTFGASYFLIPPESGLDATGQLAAEYPSMYDDGYLWTRLVRQFAGGGSCPPFRLFQVTGHQPGVGGY